MPTNNNQEKEHWKTILGFSKYEISQYGIIRNKNTKKEVHPYATRHGLMVVSLNRDNNKHTTATVARIVWRTFKGEPPENHLVSNKNGDKKDNSINNLYISDPSDFQTDLQNKRVLRTLPTIDTTGITWKPIKDFSNYEISNKGDVRNIRNPQKFIRIYTRTKCKNITGYGEVCLYKNRKRFYSSIVKLLAQEFQENSQETKKQKDNPPIKTLKKGELSEEQIKELLRLRKERGFTFRELGKKFKVSVDVCRRICIGTSPRIPMIYTKTQSITRTKTQLDIIPLSFSKSTPTEHIDGDVHYHAQNTNGTTCNENPMSDRHITKKFSEVTCKKCIDNLKEESTWFKFFSFIEKLNQDT